LETKIAKMKKQNALITAIFLLLTSGIFAQNGIIKGKITDAISNEPVMFANVLVMGTSKGTNTDEEGNYEISGLEPGLYDIRASFIGYNEVTQYEIQVTSAKPVTVNFKLEEQSTQLEEVVIKASPFKKTEESPVSLRTIGVAEIQRNPGANRDISKVVQTLPGVTSPSSFRNDLIIRGGAPNENRFYLDDVEVPNINHFATQGASGGPVGLINVNFIREVDFYSGAFPANRGNALSSVFNFKQIDGRDDRLGGTFMVGASDIGLTLEGPVSDKTTFIFSVRRSYLQFLFRALGLPFLPTYNDFQTKVKYKIDQKNEIYFVGLGALDQFQLNLDANETEEQQYLLNNLPVAPQWNYTNGLVYKHYQDNGYWTFVLSRNMLNNEARKYFENDDSDPDNLILEYKSQEIENKFRAENTTRIGDYKINAGINYEFVRFNNSTFNKVTTPSGPQTVSFASNFDMNKYGLFGQVSRKYMNDRLILSLGFRMDGNTYSELMSNPLDQFSPRFSLAYAITDRMSFNFNTGRYYQLPPYTVLGFQRDDRFLNKESTTYIQSDHIVAGLEFNTASNSKITLEGYLKMYDDYPFLTRDSVTLANLGGDFGVIGNEPSVSRSAGRTYGMEVLFQQRLYKGFYGIASYTLGFSEFEDKNFNLVASSWDARHIVNLTVGKKFGKNWEIGINWRYQSGLPFTPFDPSSALVQNWNIRNAGIPDFDQINTLRADPFNTIDIRVDKKWFFKKWSLNLYLDIENLTSNAAGRPVLILDRPLDDNNTPIGDGVIENPNDPVSEQRYKVKSIQDATGTLIPSIGIMVEF
jgi:hypothetical protein